MSYNYLPIPPRAWSRVQSPCTYTIPGSTYSQSYIPLTNQTVSQAEADYQEKLLYKGNILQYKNNSSRLTKKQRYTQLAKGLGPNRTKVFATQSETYTNPNTTGLLRVNSQKFPFPNQLVGEPNNISGPFQYNVPNPNGCPTGYINNDCSGNCLEDGGNLVCGTYVNQCTGQIIKAGNPQVLQCYPTYCSDVPGTLQLLCWSSKLNTWFPRQRLTMNNSGNQFPEGYKGFVSAVTPEAPVLILESSTCNSVTLSWNNINNNCISISSFNIYQNGILLQTVPYTINSTTISGIVVNTTYSFFITSVSNTIESIPSNIILFIEPLPFEVTNATYTVDSNCNYIVTFTGNGNITFHISNLVDYTVTGGGGKGGDGPQGGTTNAAGGGGGGGGGGTNINTFTPAISTPYTITVGGSDQSSSISSDSLSVISNPGSNGANGSLSSGGTSSGGDGGDGGAGTNIGGTGVTGSPSSGGDGGAGGAGGTGFNGYGNGGSGGKGGDSNGGPGMTGSPGNPGIVILTFAG